jgi:hypothetical protein
MKKTIIILLMLLPSLCRPQTGYNARSMGLAGAYQSQARGADANNWNPANLALPGNPAFSLDFLNAALSIGNNSLNLSLYNHYFSQDYFDGNGAWDDAAKAEILSYIPSSGFQGFNRAQITALAASFGRYSLAVNTFAYSDVRLPFQLFAIPLQGLSTDPIPLDDIEGEAIVGTELAFSTARRISIPGLEEECFSVGATVRYLLGHAYAEIAEAEGSVLSNEDSISVEGSYRVKLAGLAADGGGQGSGAGFDLGAALTLRRQWTFGLSLHNILGGIRFGTVEERTGRYSFQQPGLSIDEFDHFEEYLDSVSVSEDTTVVSQAVVRYDLPKSLLLSASYRYSERLTLEADFQQGLNRTTGGSTIPRLAIGAEIRRLDFLPLRFGIALGGVQGSTMAFGFGIDLKHYQLDFSAANQRGFFNHSKGVNYALSQRIVF